MSAALRVAPTPFLAARVAARPARRVAARAVEVAEAKPEAKAAAPEPVQKPEEQEAAPAPAAAAETVVKAEAAEPAKEEKKQEAAPAAAAPKPAAAATSSAPASLRRPHQYGAKEQRFADVLEVMGFAGTAPELINGRLAMVGFLAAIGCEIFTQQTLASQWGTVFPFFLKFSALFSVASLAPLFRGVVNDEAFGPLTPEVEMINGRAAMVGFASLLIIEAFKGGPLL